VRWTLAAVLTLPVLELVVAILIARLIGPSLTILALLALSALGAITIKRAGMRSLGRLDASLREGRAPGPDLASTGMLFLAGLLLLFPGFVTGAAGLLLLVPPIRQIARRPLEQRLKQSAANRVAFFSTFSPGFGPSFPGYYGRSTDGVVITGEVVDDPDRPARPGEPGDPGPADHSR
jgi:UPF0716 protein FxsA